MYNCRAVNVQVGKPPCPFSCSANITTGVSSVFFTSHSGIRNPETTVFIHEYFEQSLYYKLKRTSSVRELYPVTFGNSAFDKVLLYYNQSLRSVETHSWNIYKYESVLLRNGYNCSRWMKALFGFCSGRITILEIDFT